MEMVSDQFAEVPSCEPMGCDATLDKLKTSIKSGSFEELNALKERPREDGGEHGPDMRWLLGIDRDRDGFIVINPSTISRYEKLLQHVILQDIGKKLNASLWSRAFIAVDQDLNGGLTKAPNKLWQKTWGNMEAKKAAVLWGYMMRCMKRPGTRRDDASLRLKATWEAVPGAASGSSGESCLDVDLHPLLDADDFSMLSAGEESDDEWPDCPFQTADSDSGDCEEIASSSCCIDLDTISISSHDDAAAVPMDVPSTLQAAIDAADDSIMDHKALKLKKKADTFARRHNRSSAKTGQERQASKTSKGKKGKNGKKGKKGKKSKTKNSTCKKTSAEPMKGKNNSTSKKTPDQPMNGNNGKKTSTSKKTSDERMNGKKNSTLKKTPDEPMHRNKGENNSTSKKTPGEAMNGENGKNNSTSKKTSDEPTNGNKGNKGKTDSTSTKTTLTGLKRPAAAMDAAPQNDKSIFKQWSFFSGAGDPITTIDNVKIRD